MSRFSGAWLQEHNRWTIYLVGWKNRSGIWLPVVASAALALGFFLGTWFASGRQATPETPSAAQSQQGLAAPDVITPQTVPQRRAKHN
jgi:hypothetical protein